MRPPARRSNVGTGAGAGHHFLVVSSPIRVSVLAEQPIVHAGVHGLLAQFPDRVTVCPDATRDVDVVLYDVLGLHSNNGDDLILAIKRSPGRVLALARELQPGLTARAVALGAVASVPMSVTGPELVAAIEDTATGHLQDGSSTDVDNQRARDRQLGRDVHLTAREQDILSLVVAGLSNREIAAVRYLSINTVKSGIRSAYAKIGATTRSQAVAWGVEHGFPTQVAARDAEPERS